MGLNGTVTATSLEGLELKPKTGSFGIDQECFKIKKN
jgi:hypothetical protein